MAKSNKSAAINRLHSVARLARTTLAARLLAHGFYAGQDQIMLALSVEDGQTPGQLATRLGVRPPTITKTINRLQAQGFLEKKASSSDARQAHIFMTETGRDAIRAIEKSVRKTEKQAMKGLDKKEIKQLTKLLHRIEANLSNVVYADADDEADLPELAEVLETADAGAQEPDVKAAAE
ncbi:MarR family winged helix-turn-helix transcriptional regulator [Oryzicola mucosus]|uniref:MarR family transcriptional regulator n=1 Tax=Oryzicola mucosus TaxID=2767425 RepID=A0A8J6U1D7_9HYPH|nr:MarR family transcriptional regulator [Oryzicola mucosus]MBD0414343.1 MarR family transcriptional regulator [Oryzicola mucosus]